MCVFLLLGAPDFREKNCVDNEMLNLKQALSYSHHYQKLGIIVCIINMSGEKLNISSHCSSYVTRHLDTGLSWACCWHLFLYYWAWITGQWIASLQSWRKCFLYKFTAFYGDVLYFLPTCMVWLVVWVWRHRLKQ